MFPGYVFVRHAIDKRSHVEMLKARGVVRVLGERWDRPASVADDEIAAIRRVAAADVPVFPHPYLTEGQQVRITDGPLAGLEGILISTQAAEGAARRVGRAPAAKRRGRSRVDAGAAGGPDGAASRGSHLAATLRTPHDLRVAAAVALPADGGRGRAERAGPVAHALVRHERRLRRQPVSPAGRRGRRHRPLQPAARRRLQSERLALSSRLRARRRAFRPPS